MASRSAISRARTGARLVRSPATFAHATNSTAKASVESIAMSIASGGLCDIRACSSVRTTRPRFLFVSGCSRARFAAIDVSSVCACACDTPALKRPLSVRFLASRAWSDAVFGSARSRADIINGTKKSLRTY